MGSFVSERESLIRHSPYWSMKICTRDTCSRLSLVRRVIQNTPQQPFWELVDVLAYPPFEKDNSTVKPQFMHSCEPPSPVLQRETEQRHTRNCISSLRQLRAICITWRSAPTVLDARQVIVDVLRMLVDLPHNERPSTLNHLRHVLPRHLQYHELSTRQYVSPTTHGVFSNRDKKGLQIDFRPARVFKQHLSILLGFMQIGG